MGQRVLVRFDPFDLAEVKIVHRGAVVLTARPSELVARTFAKAISHPPTPPRRLDSSAGFKERLVAEAAERDESWSPPRTRAAAGMGVSDFGLQLSGLLGGRVFGPEERQQLADFHARHAPLQPDVLLAAVSGAVTLKGHERPLPYYLDTVKSAHWAAGGRA